MTKFVRLGDNGKKSCGGRGPLCKSLKLMLSIQTHFTQLSITGEHFAS